MAGNDENRKDRTIFNRDGLRLSLSGDALVVEAEGQPPQTYETWTSWIPAPPELVVSADALDHTTIAARLAGAVSGGELSAGDFPVEELLDLLRNS